MILILHNRKTINSLYSTNFDLNFIISYFYDDVRYQTVDVLVNKLNKYSRF